MNEVRKLQIEHYEFFGGFLPCEKATLVFWLMKMNKMDVQFLAAIKAGWKQEIERAIDKAQRPKRTAWDQWFRRAWYRQQWQNKRKRGTRMLFD